MGWANTLLQLSPLIINLSKIAEKAFEHKPKSGAEKKQFVHQATKDILTGAGQITTGGAHDTFEIIDKVAPSLIDVIASFLFSKPKHENNSHINELSNSDYTDVLLK